MSFRLDPMGALLVDAAAAAGIGVLFLAIDEAEARTLYVNDVFARWIGQPADAVVLRPTFECVAPEDRERMATTFAQRRDDPTVPTSVECTIESISGERIPVTAIGGTIRIESEEGRGTTVHVQLPRAQPMTMASAASISPASPRPHARRSQILILEDQAALGRTLAHALRDRYDVTLAGSVAEAIAALDSAASPPDVILCDLLLPDGTGADLYERTTRLAPSMAERFVFMTGGAFLPSLAEFLERVPNARIDKPFGLPTLEDLLERVIDTRARGDARATEVRA